MSFRINSVKAIPGVKNSLSKRVLTPKQSPKQLPKIDVSGEENGYFKVGDRIVNIIFPR